MKKGAILLIMSILTGFASDIYAKSAPVFLQRYALVIGSNTATKSRPALRVCCQ